MANYFDTGMYDARGRTFYASNLPPGTMPNSETRATYRAGWIAARAARGQENLPAYFLETKRGLFYWITALEHGAPIYAVTRGEPPTNAAGYRDLAALMALKNDRFDA